MSVKLLKMLYGDELVGDVTETENGYKIENPLTLYAQQNPQTGETQVGFTPTLGMSADDECEVGSTHVVYCVNASEELVDNYNKVFNPSEILTRESKIILTN